MPIPTPDEFFNKTHLYESFAYRGREVFDVAKLIFFNETIDSYCPACGREATFKGQEDLPIHLNERNIGHAKMIAKSKVTGSPIKYPIIKPNVHITELQCTRHYHHLQ